MGACTGKSQTSLEILINDIWLDSDLTKISPESYFNFFKRFIESSKDLLNIDEQDEHIYSIFFTGPNYKDFFLDLKCDLIFVGNNGKLHLIMLALLFFTNSKDYNQLVKYFDKLFSVVKYYFNIKEEIQTDKEFFYEVLDVYLLINTQLSLKHVKKTRNKNSIFSENEIKEDEEYLNKWYEKKYRDMLIKKLLDSDEFFYLNKFIQDHFDRLSPINIRNQLRNLYFEVNKN
jgi:hypothetical protein